MATSGGSSPPPKRQRCDQEQELSCRPTSCTTGAELQNADYTPQPSTSYTLPKHEIMVEGEGIQLWDYAESLLISQVTDLEEHLNNKIPVILGEISFNPVFCSLLIKFAAINKDTRDNIQVLQTPAKMGEELFKGIKTVGHLRGLLMSLAEDEQDFIITNMGFDPDEFKDGSPAHMKAKQYEPSSKPASGHSPTDSSTSSSRQRQSASVTRESMPTGVGSSPSQNLSDTSEEKCEELMKGIREHCESLDRTILRIPQFDMEDQDQVHDIRPYLMRLQIQLDKDGQKSKLHPIREEEIFSQFMAEPSPQTVLLSGAVGQGKTTFIKGYISKWCKSQLTGPTKKEMMVFIPAVTIEGDVLTSVKNNICGKLEKRREEMYQSLKIGDTTIFIDGIDELRDSKILSTIKEFIEDCQKHGTYKLLVSTRDNLAGVNKVSFDRHILIQGFSVEQGLEYAEKYLGDFGNSIVVDHLRNEKDREEIRTILMNPLRVHILSVAFRYKLLQIKDLANLRTSHLYECLECLVTLREEQKSKSVESIEDKKKYFYRMTVYSMLKNKIALSEDLLKLFHLDDSCPLLRLLTKSHAGKTKTWRVKFVYTAPHESYLEFWCAKGIMSLDKDIRKLILLYLCSKNVWNTIQLMMYGVLALQDDQDTEAQLSELRAIIRYMLVMLPHKDKYPSSMSLRQEGDDLITMIEAMIAEAGRGEKDMLQLLLLEQSCPTELITRVQKVHDKINHWFDIDYQQMRDQAWFSTIHPSTNDDNPIAVHIHRCLEQSLPEQLVHVTGNTLGKMLPCRDVNGRMIYHAEGSPRWGRIDTKYQVISAWCPKDGTSILNQTTPGLDSQQPTGSHTDPQQGWDVVKFNCKEYRHLFGSPQASAYSQSCWEELFMVTAGVCKKIRVNLEQPMFTTSANSVHREHARNHILPVLEAVKSAHTHLSNKNMEEVRVRIGYILLSEMAGWLGTMSQTGGTRVVLDQTFIVIDETGQESRKTLNKIKQSECVEGPRWFRPPGEMLSELFKPTSGIGSKIQIWLGTSGSGQFTHLSSDVYSEQARCHILPILAAVKSAYSHLSHDKIGEVRVVMGYIFLSELAGWLDTMLQDGGTRVVLNKPYIVIDETNEEKRKTLVDKIKESKFLISPECYTQQGKLFRDTS